MNNENQAEPASLEVRNLTLSISGAKIIRDVSFRVKKGEIVAIVGESGCGKSVTSLAVMGLSAPNVRRESGQVLFGGVDATNASPRDRVKKLGVRNAMIFQEPIASLNPLVTVGAQIEEAYTAHARARGHSVERAKARRMALAAMERVRIIDAERRFDQFPFELSGGMCQRIMIASALVTDPDLLIADEPTTALDATIQLQVLNLIRELRSALSMSVVIVTHDLGVVADVADSVVVMYAGAVVETGTVEEIFSNPRHPYTRKLLDVVTAIDSGGPKDLLPTIDGTVLSPFQEVSGCRFQPRCHRSSDICLTKVPPLLSSEARPDTQCACWAANPPAQMRSPG